MRSAGNREAQDDAAIQVDGEGDVRPADDRALVLADKADIARCAVDLHSFPGCRRTRMRPREQAERARLCRSLPPPDQPRLVAGTHPRFNGFGGGWGEACSRAAAGDLVHQALQAGTGAFGVVLVDGLLDHRLAAGNQPLCTGSAAYRQEMGNLIAVVSDTAQQTPYPARGEAECRCCSGDVVPGPRALAR